MDVDEYEAVVNKPLRLSKEKVKKGKKKIKKREDLAANISLEKNVIITTTTKAQEAFKAKQAKITEERILKKASKTHKQRVEEFNKHLDSLSEHYDIPKVSWTK